MGQFNKAIAIAVCATLLGACASSSKVSAANKTVKPSPRYKYTALTGSRIKKVVNMDAVNEDGTRKVEVTEDTDSIKRQINRNIRAQQPRRRPED